MKTIVLLMAYNEAKHIGDLISRIPYPVLVVDDGSRDATGDQAAAKGAHVVRHPVNQGVGAGFRTGLAWAIDHGIELIVHMDADGQFDPAEIAILLKEIESGQADYVLGSRFINGIPEGMGAWKAYGLMAIARCFGVSDMSCGFRALNRKTMLSLRPTNNYDYIQQSLLQAQAAKLRIKEVPIHVKYGPAFNKGMSQRPLTYAMKFFRNIFQAKREIRAHQQTTAG